MPNIEDLMKQYAKEIAGEKEQFQQAIQTRVSRDSVRRPWDDVAETPKRAAPAATVGASPNTPIPRTTALIWYNSWQSIKDAVKRNKVGVQISFYVTMVVACFFAQFITSTFNSTLHLFAPEKPNNIASRLQIFSNRVEFASFPVDLKVPLGLIARRLRGEPARQWVLAQYALKPKIAKVPIDPDIVRAETFYAEGSELLVVQGYANDPQIAADVTNLYWDYLELEINKINKEHLARVRQWLDLTTTDVNRKLRETTLQLSRINVAPLNETTAKIDAKLSETLSETEIRSLKIQRELEELKKANASQSLDRLWAISIPEIQDLRAVDRALQEGNVGSPPDEVESRRLEIQNQAFRLSQQLYSDRSREYSELLSQEQRMKSQLDKHADHSVSSQLTEIQRELLQSEALYKSQLDELGRLATQISVETDLSASRLRVIQPALPDPTSRRPMLVLVYTVCLLLALFAAILFLMGCELRASAKAKALKKKENPGSDRARGGMPSPFAEPHSPGLGV